MSEVIINSQNLYKTYHDGASVIEVLKHIDFSVDKGDRIAIVGPSGSGKSTFLHLLGGLDKPTRGEVLIHQTSWQHVNEKQRCQLRNRHLGFVYQFHHLLPEFTALENVALPLLLSGVSSSFAEEQAAAMLDDVGLKPRKEHKPAQLSGGERQRVAIARALVHKPQCVLADEPTGNLDQVTASKVFDLMLELNRSTHAALVIVTHDVQIAKRMDKIFILQEGILSRQE